MKRKISYIGTKGIIRNSDGKILITQEPTFFEGGGKWELPGGKLSEDEAFTSLPKVLEREIREELGEQIDIEIGELFDIVQRPWNKPGDEADMVFLATYLATHRGGDITLSDENIAYAWIDDSDLPNYVFIEGYLPVIKRYFSERAK